MTNIQNLQDDENNPENYAEKVTFSNYKPDPENLDEVVVIPSSYAEAEEWGAMPISGSELEDFLGIKGIKDV